MHVLMDFGGGDFLGQYTEGADFDCFKRSGCTQSCCGLNLATSAIFEYLQRQINGVNSAAGAPVALLSIDGKLGPKTMAALVAANKYVAGTSEMGMVVGSQSLPLLAKYADSISSYLAQRADDIARRRGSVAVYAPIDQPQLPIPPKKPPVTRPGVTARPTTVRPTPAVKPRWYKSPALGVVAALAAVGLVGTAIYATRR